MSGSKLKVSVHDETDVRLPFKWKKRLKEAQKNAIGNVRIISSDNITGKDYTKRYGILSITEENEIDISDIEPAVEQRQTRVAR